jgi:Tol biopolymer transport system component
MKSFLKYILSVLLIFSVSTDLLATESQLREIIVSHTDKNNILQLYYVKEDGSSKRQITNSTHGCLQPAVSPNGRKIIYLQMSSKGMSIWISDIDGNNSKVLTKPGRNLIPSWFP